MELKIRRLFRLHKMLVLYSVLIMISILFFFVGLLPAVRKSIAMVQELRVTKEEISRIQKKANLLSSLDQSELQKNAETLLWAVPSERSVPTLLSTIEGLAAKHDIFISEMMIEGISSLASNSGRLAVKPEGNIITETLSLQGDLVQLRNFLFESTRVRRLMRIKDLTLSSLPKTNRIMAQLVIEMFYLPLPVSIGKPSDPLEPFSQRELETLGKIASFPIVYASGGAPVFTNSAPVQGNVPTEPSVLDPFAPPKRVITPVPSLTPRPTPLATATPIQSGPTPTVRAGTPTPRPSSSPTPSPAP